MVRKPASHVARGADPAQPPAGHVRPAAVALVEGAVGTVTRRRRVWGRSLRRWWRRVREQAGDFRALADDYQRFMVAKRDGTQRPISAPSKPLRTVQRWALRKVWRRFEPHDAAHGFVRWRSTVTNAQAHAGATLIVKLDLRGFFPSVQAPRVRGVLRRAGVPAEAAELLALLATEPSAGEGPRVLPQGAPSSPAVTNVLCRRMDRRLTGLARRRGLVFTRYADDLTFSWRPTPASSTPPDPRELVVMVRRIVRSEGFDVHERKTHVQKGGRLTVTGLVVNAAPDAPAARVPREVVRRLRAAVHNREHGRPGPEKLHELRGLAAHVHAADPEKGRELLERIDALDREESEP